MRRVRVVLIFVGSIYLGVLAYGLGAFGADNSATPSSEAYEYQYGSVNVTGSGTIQTTGQVSFDISAKGDNGAASGTCTVTQTKPAKTKVKCLNVTSMTFSATSSGGVATFSGNATVNGTATTYTISVVDNGSPGSNDSFTLSTGSGYTASGTLTSGNITVHIQ